MIFTGPLRAPGRRTLWAATCTAALSGGWVHAAETTFEGIVITTNQHAEDAVDERSAALDFHLAVPAGRAQFPHAAVNRRDLRSFHTVTDKTTREQEYEPYD